MNDQQKRNVEILIERAIAKAQKEQWGDFAYIPEYWWSIAGMVRLEVDNKNRESLLSRMHNGNPFSIAVMCVLTGNTIVNTTSGARAIIDRIAPATPEPKPEPKVKATKEERAKAMLDGRLQKALDRRFNWAGVGIQTLGQHLAEKKFIKKTESVSYFTKSGEPRKSPLVEWMLWEERYGTPVPKIVADTYDLPVTVALDGSRYQDTEAMIAKEKARWESQKEWKKRWASW